jgi:hypothetical protein
MMKFMDPFIGSNTAMKFMDPFIGSNTIRLPSPCSMDNTVRLKLKISCEVFLCSVALLIILAAHTDLQ